MELTSPVFENNSSIPSKYTCDGENINPPLLITDVPDSAQSLVLLIDDPDIPDFVKQKFGVQKWDHWALFNIPANTKTIEENTAPGTQGVNTGGKALYGGPCPPDREHRYFFKLYALDTPLDLLEGCTMEEVKQAMHGHILEQTELIGLYER